MNQMEHAEKLLSLVEEGTSPFHVAASVERQLAEAGFQKLNMRQDWSLENGGKYYLVHNGSSLAAFTIGKHFAYGDTFRAAAARTFCDGCRLINSARNVFFSSVRRKTDGAKQTSIIPTSSEESRDIRSRSSAAPFFRCWTA